MFLSPQDGERSGVVIANGIDIYAQQPLDVVSDDHSDDRMSVRGDPAQSTASLGCGRASMLPRVSYVAQEHEHGEA